MKNNINEYVRTLISFIRGSKLTKENAFLRFRKANKKVYVNKRYFYYIILKIFERDFQMKTFYVLLPFKGKPPKPEFPCTLANLLSVCVKH